MGRRLHPSDNDPELVWSYCNGVSPALSIVVTVFNQSLLISDIAEAVCSSISEYAELILIDDGSEDDSLNKMLGIASTVTHKHPNIIGVWVYHFKKSQFETICDDFGIRAARSRKVMLLQADMLITESGFDQVLSSALDQFPDIIMISGRGTQLLEPAASYIRTMQGSCVQFGPVSSRLLGLTLTLKLKMSRTTAFPLAIIAKLEYWAFIIKRTVLLRNRRRPAHAIPPSDATSYPGLEVFRETGKAGHLSYHDPASSDELRPQNQIWLSQSVPRGPILLDRNKYLQVGGFDTDSFILAFDEDDLALRAYLAYGYRVGFVPIGYQSSLDWGTTRKPRSLKQTMLVIAHTQRIARSFRSSTLYLLSLEEISSLPLPEIRRFQIGTHDPNISA